MNSTRVINQKARLWRGGSLVMLAAALLLVGCVKPVPDDDFGKDGGEGLSDDMPGYHDDMPGKEDGASRDMLVQQDSGDFCGGSAVKVLINGTPGAVVRNGLTMTAVNGGCYAEILEEGETKECPPGCTCSFSNTEQGVTMSICDNSMTSTIKLGVVLNDQGADAVFRGQLELTRAQDEPLFPIEVDTSLAEAAGGVNTYSLALHACARSTDCEPEFLQTKDHRGETTTNNNGSMRISLVDSQVGGDAGRWLPGLCLHLERDSPTSTVQFQSIHLYLPLVRSADDPSFSDF